MKPKTGFSRIANPWGSAATPSASPCPPPKPCWTLQDAKDEGNASEQKILKILTEDFHSTKFKMQKALLGKKIGRKTT